MRIAAVGDLHIGVDSAGAFRDHLEHLGERADVLLVAGDVTRLGRPEEAAVAADELHDVGVPVVAVLGNHDLHSDQPEEVRRSLEEAGITVIEGESAVIEVGGRTLGIAGTVGFGGGFVDAGASSFGEREMKAFVARSEQLADSLERSLRALETDVRLALTHYAPIQSTLEGEPREIHPFLGSYLLAEAVDRAGAELAIHGHAHRGREHGETPGGIPVRNVAWPVIDRAYAVYELTDGVGETAPAGAVHSQR
ncbi:MAG TPA: metallophosphoesterase [Actinomycetota bacterium]|jgi:Icc-related predicted phosphoesterase|nr:metallophosphoesterase [Actinomycetota bacterium]